MAMMAMMKLAKTKVGSEAFEKIRWSHSAR